MANASLVLDETMVKGRKIKVTKSNENSTIFIGNIRKTWTSEEVETKVRRIFHNVGKIEYFSEPNNPQRNRGFCFAIFNNRNEAIKALNYVANKGGINIDGIPLTCDWADVVDDDDSDSNQIFLSGINEAVDGEELKTYFSKFGTVHSVVLSKNHVNSKRKDLAFITFDNHNEAANAVKGFNADREKDTKEEILKVFKVDDKAIRLISISLAFSQQAMMTKKKIKDGRKKINQISLKISSSSPQKEDGKELMTSALISNPLLGNSMNATTMLAMMNLININKNNPNFLSQMMNSCLGGNMGYYGTGNNRNNINQISNNKKFLNKKRRFNTGTSPSSLNPSLPFNPHFNPLTTTENANNINLYNYSPQFPQNENNN